jgi:hypothetical protein
MSIVRVNYESSIKIRLSDLNPLMLLPPPFYNEMEESSYMNLIFHWLSLTTLFLSCSWSYTKGHAFDSGSVRDVLH